MSPVLLSPKQALALQFDGLNSFLETPALTDEEYQADIERMISDMKRLNSQIEEDRERAEYHSQR